MIRKTSMIAMHGRCRVNGRTFDWSRIPNTLDFPKLSYAPTIPSAMDVLRITGTDDGFDIVSQIFEGTYYGGIVVRSLNRLLVIGKTFPNESHPVAPGFLIRLRPRISILSQHGPLQVDVERVLQWSLSSHFRAVRVNYFGQPQSAPSND